MATEGAALRRRRLGAELKRCRESSGLTQRAVAGYFDWKALKVSRIETGRVPVTARDARDLLTLYGFPDGDYREALVDLARQSGEREWWNDYKDVVRPGNFVGMEAGAAAMRLFEPFVIPGLLQTESYMRATMGTRRHGAQEVLDRRIQLRLLRQQRLFGPEPLELAAIIDEAVLRRNIGGRAVMRDQIEHLLEINQLPNVAIRILPFSFGEHLFIGGPVALLEFRGAGQSDLVYMEGLAGDIYEELPSQVTRYRDEFDRLGEGSLDHRDSLDFIERLCGRGMLPVDGRI